jgi:hypothetical protein
VGVGDGVVLLKALAMVWLSELKVSWRLENVTLLITSFGVAKKFTNA